MLAYDHVGMRKYVASSPVYGYMLLFSWLTCGSVAKWLWVVWLWFELSNGNRRKLPLIMVSYALPTKHFSHSFNSYKNTSHLNFESSFRCSVLPKWAEVTSNISVITFINISFLFSQKKQKMNRAKIYVIECHSWLPPEMKEMQFLWLYLKPSYYFS